MAPVIRQRQIATLVKEWAPGRIPADALTRHLQALQILARTRPRTARALLRQTARLSHVDDVAVAEKGGA